MAAATVPSIHFRSKGKSTDGSETLPDGYTMSSIIPDGETSDQLCVGDEATIDGTPL